MHARQLIVVCFLIVMCFTAVGALQGCIGTLIKAGRVLKYYLVLMGVPQAATNSSSSKSSSCRTTSAEFLSALACCFTCITMAFASLPCHSYSLLPSPHPFSLPPASPPSPPSPPHPCVLPPLLPIACVWPPLAQRALPQRWSPGPGPCQPSVGKSVESVDKCEANSQDPSAGTNQQDTFQSTTS